jgi:transcription initiation factor TFIIB
MQKISVMNRDQFQDIFNSVRDYGDISEIPEDDPDVPVEESPTAPGICSICNEDSLSYHDGAYFCHLCGCLQEIRLNQDPEWRFYGDSDSKGSDPTRVGMPMNVLLPESSLGTMISNRGNRSFEFDKMRQYHSWNTMPYKERSLYRVYERLQNKALLAGIPKFIIENAKLMYKNLSEAQISRGANRRGLMASCIYISCKIQGVPRSAKEIAAIYDLKVNEMTRGCKKFLEIMDISKKRTDFVLNSSTPLHFVKRFCSNLELDEDAFHICEYVAYMTTKLDIVDENTPPSIAAGSIFLVISSCHLNVSKKTVSKACKTSEVTISKCYKKLYVHRMSLLPKSILEKYNIVE